MSKSKITKALTVGLLAGYGGQTDFQTINRGGFDLKSSHFEKDGIRYHDEWTNGGGQEIIEVSGQRYTRVYAGGVQPSFSDSSFVTKKLIGFIQQLQDQTRLFSDAEIIDGDWKYHYQVITRDDEFDITVGQENITFRDETVFVHCFILSPISP